MNPGRPPGDPEYELYDHRHDPLDAQAARLKPDADAGRSMSADELERLRSLGYIQ